MENKHSDEGHLLRVVLEHVICIPSVTPTGLEGCANIDVSYRIGVVYFKLKRLTHCWNPNEWQVLGEKHSASTNRAIERLYAICPGGLYTRPLRGKMSMVHTVQHRSKVDRHVEWNIYRELLLSIPLIIGTAKPGVRSDSTHIISHTPVNNLGPTFFMQWPDSCEKGSLPPFHSYVHSTTSLIVSRSTSLGGLEKLVLPARRTQSIMTEEESPLISGRRVTVEVNAHRKSSRTDSVRPGVYVRSRTLSYPTTVERSDEISRRPQSLYRSTRYQRHSVPQSSIRSPIHIKGRGNRYHIQESVEI
ncbi:unnamed protein product [Echinostoma caproni]|uniref:FERM domain-containing protein n=1 Tax=Echinostoma caproni TaxID=27848 RepID=A0A183B7D5_9TREM|nr:unnamed protein product [Echinostoma caproni]